MAQHCASAPSRLLLLSSFRTSFPLSLALRRGAGRSSLQYRCPSTSSASHPSRRYIAGRFRCMASEGATAATTAAPPAAESPSVSSAEAAKLLSGLDLRVGRILKAWKHPEADSLYVEEVDVGEADGPRTICSGLVKYIPEEDMQDRLVVVLANLKPRNMRGVKSNGMLLAASDASHENVELLVPPEGAQPGERIWFGGEEEGTTQETAATANQLQKKKIWETIQPILKTTDKGVAAFEDKPMRVAAGPITSKSLTGANIG